MTPTVVYHILPDLTQFIYTVGAVIMGFLAAYPLFVSKLHKIKTDMEVVKTKQEATDSRVVENRGVAVTQLNALAERINSVSLAVAPKPEAEKSDEVKP